MAQLDIQRRHFPEQARLLVIPALALFAKLHLEVQDESA